MRVRWTDNDHSVDLRVGEQIERILVPPVYAVVGGNTLRQGAGSVGHSDQSRFRDAPSEVTRVYTSQPTQPYEPYVQKRPCRHSQRPCAMHV